MVRFFSLAIIMMLFVACTVTGESMIPPTVTPLVAQVELSAITPVSVQTATQQVTTPTPKATLVPTFTPTPTITTEAMKDNTPTATVDPIESVKLPDECYEDLSKVESFDEFQPCSIFQYSPDQRFLGFFYGPEYCMRGIIIFDLEEETTIYKSGIGSGARFEFLTNGKALITTGHCEGAQVDLFDPNTGEIKRLGGAGIGRENTVWNLERTAVAVSTMQYAGVRGAIWGYNVEKDFVFLSQPTTWGIDNHMMWSPDGSHILYQHRKLGDGLAYSFTEARQIIRVNADTGEKQVLASDSHYDYHFCEGVHSTCDQWDGDWIQVRRFPFEPQEIPFTDGYFYISEVTCLLYGKACGESPELLALNWQTGQLMPWNELVTHVTPTPSLP